MNKPLLLSFPSKFLSFLAICGLVASARAQDYTITDLGALGGSYSEAYGLNKHGSAVGEWDPGASPFVRAFYYHDGTNTDLPTLGGVYGWAFGINDDNRVVGESSGVGVTSDIHAFAYQNGTISDLGTLGGNYFGGYSSARAINGSGLIVGISSLSASQSSTSHAVLWSNATKIDLGVLAGHYSSANGINNLGVIVGETAVVPSAGVTNIHAFICSNNVMSDLGGLNGSYSSAKAINDSGLIAGEAEAVQGGITNLHAIIWRDGVIHDLGTFGGSSSSAMSVNAAGQVAGYSYDANETSFAFLYDGTNLVNLIDHIPTNSGWTNLTMATAINDAGQIAGSGLLANGAYHAFLLTPVSRTNAPLTLSSAALVSSGDFQFTVHGSAGETFVIQGSTNLVDWVSLYTNTLTSADTNIVDAAAGTLGNRYYRAMLSP